MDATDPNEAPHASCSNPDACNCLCSGCLAAQTEYAAMRGRTMPDYFAALRRPTMSHENAERAVAQGPTASDNVREREADLLLRRLEEQRGGPVRECCHYHGWDVDMRGRDGHHPACDQFPAEHEPEEGVMAATDRKKIRTARRPEEDLREAQERGAAFARVLSGHERVLSGRTPWHRAPLRGDDLLRTGRHDTLKLHPHYSDAKFKRSQPVYCVPERCGELRADDGCGLPGLTYNYEDRLKQWDYGKWCAALDAASKERMDTAAWLSFLGPPGAQGARRRPRQGDNAMSHAWQWEPEEPTSVRAGADALQALMEQAGAFGETIVGVSDRSAALRAWHDGPRTARAAFRWLVAACRDRAALCEGDRAERYRRIAGSIDLIATLEIPEHFSARHVLAGFRAQQNEACDRIAEMLEDEGVEPVARFADAAPLWRVIADQARAAGREAREMKDRAMAGRWMTIASTYLRGMAAFRRGRR